MKKQIKESSAFVFDPTDPSRLIDGSYNISKIDDPVEFKRLNTYLSTVIGYNYDGNRRANLSGIRQKLNNIGFDFDLPKTVSESDNFSMRVPLKRFGGISGIDDQGKVFDNPHGPGPKFDISFQTVGGILSAKIIPVGATYSTDSMQEAAPIVAALGRAAASPAGRKVIATVASTLADKAIDNLSKKKEDPSMNEHKELVEELLEIIDALCEELGIDPNDLLNESKKDGNTKKGSESTGKAILGSKGTTNQHKGPFGERLGVTLTGIMREPEERNNPEDLEHSLSASQERGRQGREWPDTRSSIEDLVRRHQAGEDIAPESSAKRAKEAERQSARRDRRAGIKEPSQRQATVSPDEEEAEDVPPAPESRDEMDASISAAAKERKKQLAASKAERLAAEKAGPEAVAAREARLRVTEGLSFANVMKRYLK